MRKPAMFAVLGAPFAVAALPLVSLLFWPSGEIVVTGVAYASDTPATVSPPVDEAQASYGYNVDDPSGCTRSAAHVEG